MNLNTIFDHLPERRRGELYRSVVTLEAGFCNGLVRNQDFTAAKDVINNAVADAAEAFLKGGPPQDAGFERTWWGRAYDANALIASFDVHNLPVFLRRTKAHGGLAEYAAFLEHSLLPLHVLLQAAKPFIVKRGDVRMPSQEKTPEQLARDAAQMTCQCCGKKFLANLGRMAHHGYRRPGDGWRTASCEGAKESPFEVDHDALRRMLVRLKAYEAGAVADRQAIKEETLAIRRRFADKSGQRGRDGRWPDLWIDITRENFAPTKAGNPDSDALYGIYDLETLRSRDLAARDREIADIRREIAVQQARYDGWKQTHRWDSGTSGWALV